MQNVVVSATRALRAARPSYHHGNLEQALTASAIKLVRKNGPDHLSLRAVAADVGVSPSAAYHYFPDKESLIQSIGNQLFAELAQLEEKAVAVIQGSGVRAAKARFRAIGEVYFQWACKEPNLFRLMFGGFCSDKSRSHLNQPAYQLLQKTLDELVTVGAMSKKMRKYGELLAWSTVQGASTLIIEGHLPKEAFEQVLDGLELSLGIGA